MSKINITCIHLLFPGWIRAVVGLYPEPNIRIYVLTEEARASLLANFIYKQKKPDPKKARPGLIFFGIFQLLAEFHLTSLKNASNAYQFIIFKVFVKMSQLSPNNVLPNSIFLIIITYLIFLLFF